MAKTLAIRLQRDIDELLASRKPLAIAGKRSKVLSAFYCLRPLLPDSEPIMFLFHASKKGIPRSHDRNKQKRRMREAVRNSAVFEGIGDELRESSKQALVLLRTMQKPSKKADWQLIVDDINMIGLQLRKVLANA